MRVFTLSIFTTIRFFLVTKYCTTFTFLFTDTPSVFAFAFAITQHLLQVSQFNMRCKWIYCVFCGAYVNAIIVWNYQVWSWIFWNGDRDVAALREDDCLRFVAKVFLLGEQWLLFEVWEKYKFTTCRYDMFMVWMRSITGMNTGALVLRLTSLCCVGWCVWPCYVVMTSIIKNWNSHIFAHMY